MSQDVDVRGQLITVGDIARLAGVRPSAVSNWRGRHSDFPLPVESTSGGDLFDRESVLQWLTEHGKRHQSPSETLADALWKVRDALRTWGLRLEESPLLILQLLYLRHSAQKPAIGKPKDLGALWGTMLKDPMRARAAWENGVSNLTKSAPLLARVLRPQQEFRDVDIAHILPLVAEVIPEGIDLGVAATLLLRQYEQAQGFRGAPSLTPASLTDLVLRLLEPITGTIYDPASGLGMMLVEAWRRRAGERVQLVGQEIDEYSWRLGFLHLALNETEFLMETGDTLLDDRFRLLQVDRIAVDPPLGQRIGPRNESRDERWAFGVPRSSPEWLWAQHIIFHLSDRGVGVMTTTPAALSRKGMEETIRRRIVESGILDAVIELPPGLLTGSSIPIALLVFAKNRGTNRDQVLFMDARQLGNPRRGKPHELTTDDITRIQSTVGEWRKNTFLEQPLFAASATVAQILANNGDLSPSRYVRYSGRVTDDQRSEIDERLSQLTTRIKGAEKRLQAAVREIERGLDAFVPEPSQDWPLVRLGDLLTTAPQAGTRQDPDGEGPAMPYIQTGAVSGGAPRLKVPPSDFTRGRSRGRVVRRGDLLVVSRGIDERRGGCAIVAFDEPAAYAESLIRLSPDPTRIDPDYLRSYLTSHQGRLALVAATTGSVIANLRPQALSEIEIPLPDVVTQHEIGAAINRIENGASELNEMSEVSRQLLNSLRQGVAAGLYRTHSKRLDRSSK